MLHATRRWSTVFWAAAVLTASAQLSGAAEGASAGPEIRIQPPTILFTPQAQRPIFVEIDWMEDGTHSHKPSQAVIDRIVRTFAAAGYSITIDVSNAIAHQSTLAIVDSVEGSAPVQAIMAQNFNHAADSRYFYSLWGHNYSYNGSFTTSSGIADAPGRVHLVTLGSFPGQTGTFSNQVGTFMHEFGHNLGQLHGGAGNDNYKPNYLSVMNYFYQLSGLGPSLLALGFANTTSGFDDFSYSHGLLPSLDETSLDESFGIGLGRAVDWDCNGTIETGVVKDIQNANFCTLGSALSVISDFDNWTSVSPQIRTLDAARPLIPGARKTVTCITPEEHRPIQERIDRLRAAGLLPPDGPGTAPQRTTGAAGQSFVIFNDGTAPLTVGAMSLDTAASWIAWEPQAPFTIAPGKSQEVLVFADLGQIPPGPTARRLLVQSDDLDESPYPGGVDLVISEPGGSPLSFYTVTPCRVADTRSGSPLVSQVARGFPIAVAGMSPCGIPGTAKAVSFNVTVLGATGSGHLSLWPADLGQPPTSVLNFSGGATRANNAILPLAVDGGGDLAAQALVTGGGTVHLILDVNGYFQ
jgi:hypothetical protein